MATGINQSEKACITMLSHNTKLIALVETLLNPFCLIIWAKPTSTQESRRPANIVSVSPSWMTPFVMAEPEMTSSKEWVSVVLVVQDGETPASDRRLGRLTSNQAEFKTYFTVFPIYTGPSTSHCKMSNVRV